MLTVRCGWWVYRTDLPYDVEPVRPSVERKRVFVREELGLQRGHVTGRDVGRVADKQVELPPLPLKVTDARVHLMAGTVSMPERTRAKRSGQITTVRREAHPVSFALSAVRRHACSQRSTATAIEDFHSFRRDRQMTPEPGPTSRKLDGGVGYA